MEIFSIICLVLIMFGMQHLLNWFLRKNYKDESLFALGFVLSVLTGAISFGMVMLIIEWGKNLI